MMFQSDERGSAMLVAIGILFMLGLLGAAAVQTSTTDMNIVENYQHEMHSFYVAESGIEHAYAVMRDSLNWRNGFMEQPFAGGNYTVTMVDRGTIPALLDTVVMTSRGFFQGAISVIEAKFALAAAFQWAAFSDSSMTMCGTAYTDSYDSDSGTYAATMLLESGNIGSNGQVDVCGTADVNGDATTATAGAMDIYGSGFVSGDTTSSSPLVILDPVPQSEIDDAENNNAAPAGLAGSYSYNAGTNNLRVNPGNVLVLSSGVYYFNDVDIRGTVIIPPGTSVEIYVVGDMDFGSQADVNVAGQPRNLLIFSVGSTIRIAGGAEIRAVIYAPDTQFNMSGGSELFGAYVGNFGGGVGNSNFHYDRSLGDLKLKNNLERVSWREL